MTRPWWTSLRWALLVGLGLCVLWMPGSLRAATVSDCAAAEAISELEPDERERLQQMCEGKAGLDPSRDEATLAAGLRLEGWKAAFVAGAIARARPAPAEVVQRQQGHEAWLAERLSATRTQRGKEVAACPSFREQLTRSVRDLERGGTIVIPPELGQLGADRDCVSDAEQERLEELRENWHMVVVPRRADDQIEAWVVDFDALVVHAATPVPFAGEGPAAWLLLIPRDHMITVSVTQPDLDLPWVETRRLVDLDLTMARRRAECVIIEAGVDEGSTWSVVVNGTPAALDEVSRHQQGRVTQRAILSLPRDPRTDTERIAGGARSSREIVFISDDEGTAPWASSLAEATDDDYGRCRSVAYDLTGLNSPQEQIGVAQVAVDEHCRNRGIVPSRVRTYAENYTEQAGKKLIPLDAWAEVMEVFRDLEGRLGSELSAERGASRGDLDDSTQMVVLASELRRRGVDSLLYFDVRCPESSPDVTVIGTRVDLDDFVGRSQSKVTGIDTDELLDVRSHDSHSHDLRESMEVVLSDLLSQPHVRFVAPASSVERGLPTRLRAVGVGTGVEIEVWPLRGISSTAICAHVEEINALSSFDAFTSIRDTVTRQAGKPKLRRQGPQGQADVEVGGLRKGDYVAIATAMPRGDEGPRDDRIGHALCFSVEERELEIIVDLAGFKQWSLPRTTPVSTRLSYVRVGAGVRYTSWEYFEFGARIGYELVEYSADSIPNWDDLLLIDIPASGQVPISWRRHGLFVAPFVGLRVPFGRMPWPLCRKGAACESIKERRRANPSLLTYFLDAQVGVNFGIAGISSLPEELIAADSGAVLEPDLDLGLKTGLRVRPRQLMRFGVFAGVLLTDVTNARTGSAKTSTTTSQQAFWTNDWGVRAVVGLEVAMGLRWRGS